MLHGVGSVLRQPFHHFVGDFAAHRTVGMPFDDDAGVAELTGQLGDFLDDKLGLWVVVDFKRLAVLILGHLLEDLKAIGIEVDHDGVGEDLFGPAHFGRRLGNELHDRLIRLRAVLLVLPQLVDDREIHDLIERHGLVLDLPNRAIEVIGLVPDPREVGRVVLVLEELMVLGPVGAVRIAEHSQRVGGRQSVTGGHQLGHLLLLGVQLEGRHRVEDAARQSLDDRHVIVSEVRAGEPDIGDQLVRGARGNEQPVPFHLRQFVDVGSPRDRRRDVLVRIECRRRFKRGPGEIQLHLAGLNPTGDEHVQQEVM